MLWLLGWTPTGLRTLAGLPPTSSTWDVEDVIGPALAELGIEFALPRTEAAGVAAARVLARRCLDGRVPPREFVEWMHRTFRHGQSDTLEPFLRLDDEYDITEYTGRSDASLDQEVLRAAKSLLGL